MKLEQGKTTRGMAQSPGKRLWWTRFKIMVGIGKVAGSLCGQWAVHLAELAIGGETGLQIWVGIGEVHELVQFSMRWVFDVSNKHNILAVWNTTYTPLCMFTSTCVSLYLSLSIHRPYFCSLCICLKSIIL